MYNSAARNWSFAEQFSNVRGEGIIYIRAVWQFWAPASPVLPSFALPPSLHHHHHVPSHSSTRVVIFMRKTLPFCSSFYFFFFISALFFFSSLFLPYRILFIFCDCGWISYNGGGKRTHSLGRRHEKLRYFVVIE